VTAAWFQYLTFVLVVTALAPVAGRYLYRVLRVQEQTGGVGRKEAFVYRLLGIDAQKEMNWLQYAIAFTTFTLVGTLALYGILRLQQYLPSGPSPTDLTTPLTPELAMNTAVSFSTTTTWQAYGGETTMKYWAQILGLTGQTFLAGAAGLAVGAAFIRGFARQSSQAIGNFWVDLVRATLLVLLPLSIFGAVALVWLGVPMTFWPYIHVTTLEGTQQVIARGPVAALECIKNLGTNGGGFFNTNGAHPFANPNVLTNWLAMLAIAVLPASMTYVFGLATGRLKAGWALYAAMAVIFIGALVIADVAERAGNPQVMAMGVIGPNMENKEIRFGVAGSTLTSVVTSNGATGSTNTGPDSLLPLGYLVPLCNMLLGEIVFGGLGTGIYSMVMVAMVGLFIAGLMVGRTPEYLGKKIGAGEMKLIAIFTLVTPLTVLGLTALALSTDSGRSSVLTNGGSHGLSEVIFAYASCTGNNGQVMGSLNANTRFYHVTTAVAMLAGRFGLAIPALALAGRLASQGRRAEHAGTLPSDTPLFAGVAVATAVFIGLLSFLPALALGPVVEEMHLSSK